MTPINRLVRLGLALTAAGSLALAGCSATKDAATGVGEAAKDAATATGQAALAPAVTPVLDLLKKGETEVQSGNIGAAVATLGGFKAVWDKAAPVIRPLAGDKWPAIETAANGVLSTFGGGGAPAADAAGSALTGLIGPLSSLIGK
jgi:hypothetical protein